MLCQKINYFFYFVLMFLFTMVMEACKNKPNEDESGSVFLNNTFDLKSDLIINSSALQDPTIISIIDSTLILCNYKGLPLVELYDKRGKLIQKGINIGRGPGEITIAGGIQTRNKDKIFYISDIVTKKVLEFNLNQFRTNSRYLPRVAFNASEFKRSKDIYYDKILVGNNQFIGENRSPEGRLLLMDAHAKSSGYYIDVPKKDKVNSKLSEFGNSSMYASAVVLNPAGDKIAMATYVGALLNLAEIRGNKIVELWSHTDFYPQGIEAMPMGEDIVPVLTDDAKRGYTDIAATQKYVYALFSGKEVREKNYDFGRIVRVVSWNGKECFSLKLDREVKRLTVTPDDKELYGIGINKKGEPEVIHFKIANFK